MALTFVSYNSNGCGGTITFMDADYKIHELTDCITPNEYEWDVHLPAKYQRWEDEILTMINENIEFQCCGDCCNY